MKNIRHFMTWVHNRKSGDLCQSHFCLHYMVAFIWDTASFHNYIMEMLNFPIFIHPFSVLSQECQGIVSKELQRYLKPSSLISSTLNNWKMIDATTRIMVKLLINATQTVAAVSSICARVSLYPPVILTQALAEPCFFTAAFLFCWHAQYCTGVRFKAPSRWG